MNGTIYEPGEGIRTVDLAGSTMIGKEDGSTSGGAFVVAESTFAPGMFEMPLHLHRKMAPSSTWRWSPQPLPRHAWRACPPRTGHGRLACGRSGPIHDEPGDDP